MHELITGLYDAPDARDIDRVMAGLAAGVDWPDAMSGGRVVGRDAVREHWLRQWAVLDPDLRPQLVREWADGRYEAWPTRPSATGTAACSTRPSSRTPTRPRTVSSPGWTSATR